MADRRNFLVFLVFLAKVYKGDCNCDDSSWTAYKDEKCYKITTQFANRAEADLICAEVSGAASIQTSLSVKSTEEQIFLTKFVFEDSQVVDSIWLGANRLTNGSYKWADDTNVEYTNWGEGYSTNDPAKGCVQMSSHLTKVDDGQWTDATCVKRNLVVCQKQSLSLAELMRIVMEQRQQLNEMGQQLNATDQQLNKTNQQLNTTNQQLTERKNNPVPIGFLYVELPNRPDPQRLWPNVIWQEVTTDYAGLFFRAAGGGAAAFNTEQSDNSPRLNAVQYGEVGLPKSISVQPNGEYSDTVKAGYYPGGGGGFDTGVKFRVSSGEVRPRNTAVRIWTRVQ